MIEAPQQRHQGAAAGGLGGRVPALVLADAGTRPWARWAGTGALFISLLVIVAVVSYSLISAGVERQVPTFPQ